MDERDVPKVDSGDGEEGNKGEEGHKGEDVSVGDTSVKTPDSAVHILETATVVNGHGPGTHL